MINYIIQVILFQVLFLAVYDFFLSKETFFTKNRWYLLSTAVMSFLLPLIKIPRLQKAVPAEYTIWLPEVVLSPQKVIEKAAWYQSIDYLDVLFYLGCLLFLIVFIIKLIKIVRLISVNKVEQKQRYKLVLLSKNSKAFSFFNYIFLGEGIAKEKREKIIKHELVHSEQKHSFDLLFFELLKIVMWFNPMVYVYQNRISLVHEYISDEVVSKSTPKENYINNLLSDVFQVESISFINQFYKHSLIKKRIIMMTKNKSKQIKQLKYLLLIPLLGSMLFYTSCNDEKSEQIAIKKEQMTRYIETKEGLKSSVTEKETYMDTFFGFGDAEKYKEVPYEDLTKQEKEEYDNKKSKFESIAGKNYSGKSLFKVKVLKMPNGRNAISLIADSEQIKSLSKDKTSSEIQEVVEDVPFAIIDKVPTFPGCPEGDKTCFNKSMQRFVAENFNINVANELGLPSGKKRIYLQFKIGKNGVVKDIKARAPHPELKLEAIRIAKKLPKMLPGEKDGKKVNVGYTLPITFNIQ
ncbi:BlaR1 peptidase M56 [Tenacibaculum holothuriorum]|uniref:BlaR1 peptidase M56 n=1 Tax=Tenacibaculum holothuriorum TaxID=1635173 RepID=A0A1Y2PAK3_9FLAO|nr:M56 family metallopeptidase [Tenacibaculum holothuriorum]OSY87486.1 BlaR1 peptidase M56 [Tenacibaculum holothuriorum]